MTELDVAGQVLDLVKGAAGAQTEAAVTVDRAVLSLTRFANSYIHQNVAEDTTTVRLQLHSDGRTATGTTTITTPDGLRGLVERTVQAVELSPPDKGWPGLAAPMPLAGASRVDADTAAAGPAERAERVRSFVDAAGGLETAGYCRTTWLSAAFANTAGQTAAGECTEAAMDGIARHAGADGVARHAATALSDVDGAILGARAAAKARASTDPVELPPDRYEVVLEPTAVADLLHNLAFWGFNGKLHAQRRSFAALGETQFDSSVTIVDDVLDTDEMGVPFDVEGTAKRRLVLVDAGVTRAVTHDRRSAREAGAESTGHAIPGSSSFGPIAVNARLLPGAPSAPTEVDGPAVDSSVAALVGGMRRGVLVSDLWYTRVLDPKTLAVTGLTRNGVWLVENGEIVRPVRNFRFTQLYPQALGPGAVIGIGGHPAALPGSWAAERMTAPALHLASWHFTGGASG
ncbi:MAG TPA: metallopeptidase TldD-related protein [Micromonosporaceae bacterium]|nr:metallopeptidase TldD-related protein [Micromonosporaceae bacterium]